MKTVVLKRVIKNSTGTFGTVMYGGLKWFSGERPWLDNKHGVSCIPEGTYTCKWSWFPRAKKFDYMILNVFHRDGIFVHSANFPEQVEGCIFLGKTTGKMDGRQGVFLSVTAIREFNAAMNKEDFLLEVKS